MSRPEETLKRIEAALSGVSYELVEGNDGMPGLRVSRQVVLDVLTRLKEQADFDTITLVTGVDHMASRGSREPEPRFEVVHQLHSLANGDRVRVKTPLASDEATLPSCVSLWAGAGFMERECYDMFGIRFEGHPNLKRLLMPDGYGHHPLRKDFPQQGIQPDRLYREWDRERRLADPAFPATKSGGAS